jgi:hypothetical protein
VQKPYGPHAAFWHCAKPHKKLKHLGVYPCGFRGYIGKLGGMRYIEPLTKCNLPHFDVIIWLRHSGCAAMAKMLP